MIFVVIKLLSAKRSMISYHCASTIKTNVGPGYIYDIPLYFVFDVMSFVKIAIYRSFSRICYELLLYDIYITTYFGVEVDWG